NEVSFTEFIEEGSRTTKYKTQRGGLIDVSYGVELTRGLFLAGAVSRFDGSSDVDIDQQIPHPFFFDQMRTLKGTATALKREEIAVHFQAAGITRINRRVHLFLGLGPSLFRLKQTIVKDVTYTQEYPFDEVSFASAQTELQERTRVGANIQLNIVTMVARHVGVDGLVRFSRASMSFTGSDGSKFSVRAGGLHVGIGLRAEF
ncbi:MAG TPA: hypothetical protein VJM31_08300, partial [Vicinamibacterales bacterium]|nr:hypothetical protein [Vicinamibacterales bacterium]